MGYEYGNARIAAMRGRLLDRAAIGQLGASATAPVMLAQLERSADWGPILRRVAALGVDATAALETAVEVHRTTRLAALPAFYEGRERDYVEALVLRLDAERAVAVLRRRRAREAAEAIATTAIPGALLDASAIATMARAPGTVAYLRPLVDRRVILPDSVPPIVMAEGRGAGSAETESMLMAAIERARWQRVGDRGAESAWLRRLLEQEQASRESIVVELRQAGPTLAMVVERAARLSLLDALSALGPRDPLGIGAVAGYVAAVEAQAIRLRAMIARVRAGWSDEDASPYLARNERPTWLAWSS